MGPCNCWHCGGIGHFKVTCPQLNKSYPFAVHNDNKLLGTTGPQRGTINQQVDPAEAGPSTKVKVVDGLPKILGVNSHPSPVANEGMLVAQGVVNIRNISDINMDSPSTAAESHEAAQDLTLSRIWEVEQG